MAKRNIGRGYWLKVVRIPKTGNVVKFFSERVSKEESRHVTKAHDLFVRFLREAGTNVPETRMVKKQLPSGECKLRIVQEEFKPPELGENYLRTASKQEALKFAGNLVDETIKVFHFNKQKGIPDYGLIIGADFKPDNVAVRNGKIFFIDTFSPHIRSTKDPKYVHPVFARYFKKRGWMLEKITRGYISDTVYEPKRRMASLMAELSRIRPELKKEFTSIAREHVNAEPDAEIRTELLQAIKKLPVLRAKAMGKIIAYLGKRKGMQIKLG